MKLSIITITFNNYQGLKQTLQSVFNQDCKDFEYIVIDGGSTDGSKKLIEENATKIAYWVSESDKGIYNAMNKGIRVANGEYLLFLNSGDWLIDKSVITKSINILNNCSEDFIHGNVLLEKRCGGEDWLWRSDNRFDLYFFYSSSLPHQGTYIKKSLFFVNGAFEGYDETLKIASDWAFFFEQIMFHNKTDKFIDILISSCQTGGISQTRESGGGWDDRKTVFDRHFPGVFELCCRLHIESDKCSYLLNSRVVKIYHKLRRICFIFKKETDSPFLR